MSLTEIERAEAVYNSLDVLSMCRILPHLSTALEQTNTVNVYEVNGREIWPISPCR